MAIPKHRLHAGAFTLVELLAVVAVIGILAGILIPVTGRLRESARATQCLGNIRQLSMATLLYCQGNHGRFPFFGQTNWDAAALSMIGDNGQNPPPYNDILKCPSDQVERTDGNVDQPRSYYLNAALACMKTGSSNAWNFPWNDTPEGSSPTGGERLSDIARPAQTMMLEERFRASQATYNSAWGVLTGPTADDATHGSATNISFVDGHVQRLRFTPDLFQSASGSYHGLTMFQFNHVRLSD